MRLTTLDALVIGAGMAGLGAADELRQQGRTVALVEAASGVGGLARSIRVAGIPIALGRQG